MTTTLKVLGQVSPVANTDTILYTVPAATQTVVSSIAICNQNAGGAKTFRVYIQVAGVALNVKQYLYFDQTIAANTTFVATIGLTLGAADVVTVRASATNFSFQLFGQENSS